MITDLVWQARAYRSDEASKAVFDRIYDLLIADDGERSVQTGIWRSKAPDGTRWFVMLMATPGAAAKAESMWGDGAPHDVPPGLRAALYQRHLRSLASIVMTDGIEPDGRIRGYDNHGRGQYIHRDGTMHDAPEGGE